MKTSIDLGLAVAGLHARRGFGLTCSQIAAFCDCSKQRIQQIEQRALRKLRHRERALQDFMEAYKR